MSLIRKLFGTSDKKNAKGSISVTGSNECPYCGYNLEKKPSRKKKCPNCDNYIYVRKGKLMTEEEAQIKDWLKRLEMFDVSEKDFLYQRKKLGKQFGHTPSVNDTVWRVLNNQVRGQDLHHDQMVYYEMVRLARMEGKDPNPYVSQALRTQLTELKSEGVKKVVIVGPGNRIDDPHTCQECRALQGKEYGIKKAIQEMPIPAACKNDDGCRCSYVDSLYWDNP